jgi:hypothetical protein
MVNSVGSRGVSFVEHLLVFPQVIRTIAQFKRQTNLKSKDPGYKGKVFDEVNKKYPKRFKSGRDLTSYSTLYRFLAEFNIVKDMAREINMVTDFSETKLDQRVFGAAACQFIRICGLTSLECHEGDGDEDAVAVLRSPEVMAAKWLEIQLVPFPSEGKLWRK